MLKKVPYFGSQSVIRRLGFFSFLYNTLEIFRFSPQYGLLRELEKPTLVCKKFIRNSNGTTQNSTRLIEKQNGVEEELTSLEEILTRRGAVI